VLNSFSIGSFLNENLISFGLRGLSSLLSPKKLNLKSFDILAASF
jgi:hypothetical protein